MKTTKELSIMAGITPRNIQRRVKLLDLPVNYDDGPGPGRRIFTEEEAEKIIKYKRKLHKISYSFDGDKLDTLCDVKLEHIYVASERCHSCTHFRGYNDVKQYVHCDAWREA